LFDKNLLRIRKEKRVWINILFCRIRHGGALRIDGIHDQPHLGPLELDQGSDTPHSTYLFHVYKLNRYERRDLQCLCKIR
jgi:hypothetical protein